MTKELADVYASRGEKADAEFKKTLRDFMRKYKIPVNQLNEIGVITWIDTIQHKRHMMIKWNDLWRDELNDETYLY